MLRGERVILRPLQRDDLRRLYDLHQNVDLELLADGQWRPVAFAKWERDFEKDLDERDAANFAIEVDGVLIGDCGLHPHADRVAGVAELGIGIYDTDYLSKGYGREAIGLLLDWSFRIMNYRRIWLETDDHNERAIRCYTACGFVEEGRLRQHAYGDGVYHDVVAMGMLRAEWEARTRKGKRAPKA